MLEECRADVELPARMTLDWLEKISAVKLCGLWGERNAVCALWGDCKNKR